MQQSHLPYGEELYAGLGGRTPTQGYAWDSTRQQFTGYERDWETGLDYAQARYSSPSQGRFTSPDPLGASMRAADPQSFNRYSYTQNDPVNFTDPTGMERALGAGYVPGANGAMGRVWPGVGSDMGNDTYPGQHWTMAGGEVPYSTTPAEGGQGAAAEGTVLGAAADAAPEPQNTLDNPPFLISETPDCFVGVSFTGKWDEEGPNGESIILLPSKGRLAGVGFSASALVNDPNDGIGHIGEDANPKYPTGTWTVAQRTTYSAVWNGITDNDYRQNDLNTKSPYFASENSVSWYDHPGFYVAGAKSYSGKYSFVISLSNGEKACTVRFRIEIKSNDGNWSARWGR